MTEYREIEIKKEIFEKIEQFIKSHPEYGYKNIGDFIEDAVTNGLKKIRRMILGYSIVLFSLILIFMLFIFMS